jgi:hypothetical protein
MERLLTPALSQSLKHMCFSRQTGPPVLTPTVKNALSLALCLLCVGSILLIKTNQGGNTRIIWQYYSPSTSLLRGKLTQAKGILINITVPP